MTAKKRKIKCAYFTRWPKATHRWAKMIMMENIQIMTTINESDSVTQKKS